MATTMNKTIKFGIVLAAFLVAAPVHLALAQVAPSLGTAQDFAVLGGSTVTNTGPTLLTGDLGVHPGTAVTGFPPGVVVEGTIHSADAVALQAQSDTTTAYDALASQACTTTFGVPTDIGGMTLIPGVYCFSSSAELTGTLTLDAEDSSDAVWVFKTVSTLTTASNASVEMTNGGQDCNVFWQIGSSADLGTGTNFIGNILALTSISLNTEASVSGRTLARNGAVTMDSNEVAMSVCAVPTVCGDGVVDPGEQCDDGNTPNNDACKNDCTLNVCGDGVPAACEECDDGNVMSGDGCSSTCQTENLTSANTTTGTPQGTSESDSNISADGGGCSLVIGDSASMNLSGLAAFITAALGLFGVRRKH